MPLFKLEKLEAYLHELRHVSPDVLGSTILSIDGLTIASDLPEGLSHEDRLAAESAALLMLSDRISGELGRGEVRTILMSSGGGHVVVALINERAALTVLCREDARIAMLFLDVEYTARQLAALL